MNCYGTTYKPKASFVGSPCWTVGTKISTWVFAKDPEEAARLCKLRGLGEEASSDTLEYKERYCSEVFASEHVQDTIKAHAVCFLCFQAERAGIGTLGPAAGTGFRCCS